MTASVDDVDLPRFQAGVPPQHLLTTLLGDYWFGRKELLPSAALVRLAGEFGVSSVAARAALSRLARRGLLDSSKVGRRTFYRLTDRAARVLSEGAQHIMSFGLRSGAWDGWWTVAAFSLPEEQRDLRHTLRTRLRWLGFAPLYDGMWVSPRACAEEVVAELTELGITGSTVFRARSVAGGPHMRRPIDAWDFDVLRTAYDDFIATYGPLLARVWEGEVGAAEALVTRTSVMDTWRTFPNLDPELPAELLPPDWPRSRAQKIFVEVYDRLGPLAEIRVKQIVAEYAPELAAAVHHHTTGSILAGRSS